MAGQGRLNASDAAGPGFRDYSGEQEPGVRTVFQQLPGKNISIYKVINNHTAGPGQPTVVHLRFDNLDGCTGFLWFKTCTQLHLDDTYTFLGTRGVALIQNGVPVGFLSAPASHDANGKPVYTTWQLNGNSVDITVYDAGMQHPVIVDPQYFVGAWWVGAALGAAGCFARAGLDWSETASSPRQSTVGCSLQPTLDWSVSAGQPWYDRVFHAALACLAPL